MPASLRDPRARTVEGSTTAATVWIAAALGIACGLGDWTTAVTGTVLAMVLLVLFEWLETRFGPKRSDALQAGNLAKHGGVGSRGRTMARAKTEQTPREGSPEQQSETRRKPDPAIDVSITPSSEEERDLYNYLSFAARFWKGSARKAHGCSPAAWRPSSFSTSSSRSESTAGTPISSTLWRRRMSRRRARRHSCSSASPLWRQASRSAWCSSACACRWHGASG